MKLIEAKLAKEFANTLLGDPILKMEVNAVLDNAPGFDLVRCKECVFCIFNSSNETFKCKSMSGMHRTVTPDDFCSYGERKDNE